MVISSEEVRRILGQLRNSDQVCKISQVGAFVVEFDEAVVLCVISLAKRLQGIVVASSCISVVSSRQSSEAGLG